VLHRAEDELLATMDNRHQVYFRMGDISTIQPDV
jgi:hypothetical protein